MKIVDFEDEYEKMNEYELRLILKSSDELIKNDSKEIRVLREENERLNNIINKLENYLSSKKEMIEVELVLDKLQRLKGSDKE